MENKVKKTESVINKIKLKDPPQDWSARFLNSIEFHVNHHMPYDAKTFFDAMVETIKSSEYTSEAEVNLFTAVSRRYFPIEYLYELLDKEKDCHPYDYSVPSLILIIITLYTKTINPLETFKTNEKIVKQCLAIMEDRVNKYEFLTEVDYNALKYIKLYVNVPEILNKDFKETKHYVLPESDHPASDDNLVYQIAMKEKKDKEKTINNAYTKEYQNYQQKKEEIIDLLKNNGY